VNGWVMVGVGGGRGDRERKRMSRSLDGERCEHAEVIKRKHTVVW